MDACVDIKITSFWFATDAENRLRLLTDLLPQLCGLKNAKYTKYVNIFQTLIWCKNSRQPHLPIFFIGYGALIPGDCTSCHYKQKTRTAYSCTGVIVCRGKVDKMPDRVAPSIKEELLLCCSGCGYPIADKVLRLSLNSPF